jgi:site-specific DNA recombinase
MDLQGQPTGIYLRISEDREGRELGVQRQEEDTRSLAERLDVRVVDVYSDDDISASTNSSKPRPDYERLLADARAGRIRVILAYKTSRLTRRPREHEDLIDLAKDCGTRFYFVASPNFDLNTSDGRKLARMLAAQDAGDPDLIQELTRRKKKQDAEQGKVNGGKRTYGRGLSIGTNPASGKEVLDYYALVPSEVVILQEGKGRTLSGESTRSIVVDLNNREIPTAEGGKWTVGGYRRTLLNPSYVIYDDNDPEKCGTRVHKGHHHRALYPGVFTRAEHEALKDVFAANSTPYGPRTSKPRSYVLSGIVRCGLCGGVMYGQGKTDNGRYIRRYHCKKWNNRGEQVGCGRVFRIAEPLEDLVTEAVKYRFDSPEVEHALAPAEDKQRVIELTQRLAQLTSRRKELAAEHAITPYEDYGIMLGTIKGHIEAAERELVKLRSSKARQTLMPSHGRLHEFWEHAGIEWQTAVIKLVVERVVVMPGRPGAQMFNGRRFNPELVHLVWRT